MFRRLFSRNPGPLSRPPSPRLKQYTAQNGLQYEYSYEGCRPFRSRYDSGTEFAFRISRGRKAGPTVAVFLSAGVVSAWEQGHGRSFSAAELYAIAKMALFQAFDERSGLTEMGQDVRVRTGDLEAIVAALNID